MGKTQNESDLCLDFCVTYLNFLLVMIIMLKTNTYETQTHAKILQSFQENQLHEDVLNNLEILPQKIGKISRLGHYFFQTEKFIKGFS